MTEDVKTVNDGGPPGDSDLRQQVKQALLLASLSQADLARQTGVSASALSGWFKGDYKGDNDAIAVKLTAWLAGHIAPAPELPQAGRDWVDTPTGRAIAHALSFAQRRPSIVLVYGGAGVGKTTAIRRYQQGSTRAWTLTASPAISSMAAMLRALCAALELDATGWKNQTLTADIVRRLKGSNGTLIVDEAQHLTLPALEQLRYIYDEAQIGLALIGNEDVYSRIAGGTYRRAEFAQLYSRVGRRLRLSTPDKTDIEAVLTAWSVSGREERAYATQVGSLPGGLRGLFNLLEEARLVAQGMGQPMDVRMMRAAWAELGGT